MGPSLIFDKSFLQSLSIDEAAIRIIHEPNLDLAAVDQHPPLLHRKPVEQLAVLDAIWPDC